MAGLKHLIFAAALSAALQAGAETSPLSIHPEGLGLEVSPYTSRERGMGEAGLAAVTKQGLSIPNISRTAFHDKTSFTVTLDSDLDWLNDEETSNRTTTFILPSLGLNFSMRKFGNLGFFYRQRYHRNFSYTKTASGTILNEQSFDAEGGVYEVAATYAISPIPALGLGVGYHYLLGRERMIQRARFAGLDSNATLYDGEDLPGDTLATRSTGGFPSLSLTFRHKVFAVAVSGALGTTLEQALRRGISRVQSNSTGTQEKEFPWSAALGLMYKIRNNQTLVADGSYQPWDEADSPLLNPAIHLGLGYEYQGTGGFYEPYHRKIAYRGGLGWEQVYLQEVDQYFVTLGAGLPLGRRGNLLDVALKYGHRGSIENNLWTEDFFKISLSLTGVGVWGQPVRKRR